jgi:hypothetical protein
LPERAALRHISVAQLLEDSGVPAVELQVAVVVLSSFLPGAAAFADMVTSIPAAVGFRWRG